MINENVTQAQNKAVDRDLPFDEQFQKLEAIQPHIEIVSAEDPKPGEVLEVTYFRRIFPAALERVEKALGAKIIFANHCHLWSAPGCSNLHHFDRQNAFICEE